MANVGGHTTKQTYVTTYTTTVDPRTLPDFATRGAPPAEGWRGDGNGSSVQPAERRLSAPRAAPAPHHHTGPAPLPMPPAPSHAQQQPPLPPHAQYHRGYEQASASTSSAASSMTGTDGGTPHRLRKKYTTTTVTTITTTTILLPKMQEAYIFPSVTSHQLAQQRDVGNGNGYAITDGRGGYEAAPPQPPQRRLYDAEHGNGAIAPTASQPVYDPASGAGTQAWAFHQHTNNNVETEQHEGRLPTLQDLGIASYFAKDGAAPAPQRRAAPYAPASNGHAATTPLRQPWVSTETRHEVEGGKRFY